MAPYPIKKIIHKVKIMLSVCMCSLDGALSTWITITIAEVFIKILVDQEKGNMFIDSCVLVLCDLYMESWRD